MTNLELELKAVVPDPDLVRRRLVAAGALQSFRGLMEDRRFDQSGALKGRDEVLRIRVLSGVDGSRRTWLAWKGPTTRSPEGYKQRTELEYEILAPDAPPEALLEALGFRVALAIDRYIESYQLVGAMVRLEWYPRMDVLVEVEGDRNAIEAALPVTGLPRTAFSADSLDTFVTRYQQGGHRTAALAVRDLAGAAPAWEAEWAGAAAS